MSLTKLPLGRYNSVMASLFPPRESLVVTSWLGTGNSGTFFLRCIVKRKLMYVLVPCLLGNMILVKGYMLNQAWSVLGLNRGHGHF